MPWDTTQTSVVSKAEAKNNIIQKAKDDGIKGAFKVFYDGTLMTTSDELPEQVDMSKVRISAVLDQA